MGQNIEFRPTDAPRGGIVVIQERFGVNHHIRAVTRRAPNWRSRKASTAFTSTWDKERGCQ